MRGARVEVVSETIECHFLAGKKEQIGAEGASTDTAYSPPSAVASNNRPHIHVTLLKNYCQKNFSSQRFAREVDEWTKGPKEQMIAEQSGVTSKLVTEE